MGPLKGLKVLDFSRLLPGPLCTHLLVRLGAGVVKVEGPEKDYTRLIPPILKFDKGVKHGVLYEALNAEKKNVNLDLKKLEDKDAVLQLARSYDVVVEGNRPGVMDRLGLGFEDLRKENPGLIYCSLSGYGSTGPLAQRAGHDVNYMALAGLLGISGQKGSLPPLVGYQGADVVGALQAVIGIEAALLEREKTGKGQFVDISLCESAMVLGISALSQGLAGALGDRGTGLLDGGLPNYNIYETSDGKYLSIGALEVHFWEKFCKAAGAEDMIGASQADVRKFIASKGLDEWLAVAEGCDACVEPVLNVSELPSHPQHASRGVFMERADNLDMPSQIVLGPRLSNHPPRLLRRASGHGEHNDEILGVCHDSLPHQVKASTQQESKLLSGPLAGIKVLDFTRLLPGPLAGHVLVRLGAEVLKIEQPQGDYARHVNPIKMFDKGVKHGVLYEALNAEKKNVNLDLKKLEDKDAVLQLARSYDVVVEGNRPGVMDRLGLGFEDLRKENPGLIYCSLSGYGSTGPLAQRAGHDVNYMALAGLLGISGQKGSLPPLVGYQGADVVGALQAVIGIEAALLEREKTGKGQFVDISLCESAMVLGISALSQGLAGALGDRGTGLLDGGLPNYNIYETSDGKYLSIGALEVHFWEKFCKAAGAEDMIGASQADVRKFIASKGLDEWLAAAEGCDACVEPVLNVSELPSHPQHASRGVFMERADNLDMPSQIVLGPRLSNHPPRLLRRASGHGEHNNNFAISGDSKPCK